MRTTKNKKVPQHDIHTQHNLSKHTHVQNMQTMEHLSNSSARKHANANIQYVFQIGMQR